MAAVERPANAPARGARMTPDEFCATYYDRVVGFAVTVVGGADAEDVAHEALSRALESYGSLDPERDAWPWLATVVRNAGRDVARRRRTLPIEEAAAVAVPDPAFATVAAAEEHRTLARALALMPGEDRDVLLMRERDRLPFAEMALRTGRTSGALRVHVARARQRLAREYARLGGTAYGLGVLLSSRAARLREKAAGVAGAWPSTAQLTAAVVVCGGVTGSAAIRTPVDITNPPQAPRLAAPSDSRTGDASALDRTAAVTARPDRDAGRRPAGTAERSGGAVTRGAAAPEAPPRPVITLRDVGRDGGSRNHAVAAALLPDRRVFTEGDGQGTRPSSLCSLPAGCP